MIMVMMTWMDFHRENATRMVNNWDDLDLDEEKIEDVEEAVITSIRLNKKLQMKLMAGFSQGQPGNRKLSFELIFWDLTIPVPIPLHFATIMMTTQREDDEKLQRLLGKPLVSCMCGDLAERDGKCEDCYTFNIEKEDNCCICYENGGRWARLGCGHSMHRHCLWKQCKINNTQTIKCPLCRHETHRDNFETE